MPFEVSGFGNSSNGGFDSKFTKKFDKLTDFGSKKPKPLSKEDKGDSDDGEDKLKTKEQMNDDRRKAQLELGILID